jgi:hypothetical protein
MVAENKKFKFSPGDKVILAYPECEAHKAIEDFIGYVEEAYETECTIYKDDPNEGFWVRNSEIELIQKASVVALKPKEAEYTGGSSNYYKVFVKTPTTLDAPYEAECNDIIEALKMTFAEGNAFKAIWRKAKARQGVQKKGYDNGLYDSEKVVFFGERMVVEAKNGAE